METLDSSLRGKLLGACVVVLVAYVVVYPFSPDPSSAWGSLPVMGLKNHSALNWLRATFQSWLRSGDWALAGYAKVRVFAVMPAQKAEELILTEVQNAALNIPFVVPSIERGAVIVLPPQRIKGIYNMPEKMLDAHDTGAETLQFRWTLWDSNIWKNDFHVNVIRHHITRNLETLTPVMETELVEGFAKWWGTETAEWREVPVWQSCLKLIAGASNGAFCGAPLCESTRHHDVVLRREGEAADDVFVT